MNVSVNRVCTTVCVKTDTRNSSVAVPRDGQARNAKQ